MQVAEKNDTLNLPNFGASVLNYLSWKEQTRSFDQLGAIQFAHLHAQRPRRSGDSYTGNAITPSLMPLLGLAPVVGRAFRDGETSRARRPSR